MISVKNSYEIAYNGTENECRFEMYADTAADLQGLTHIDGIKIQMGSECTDIAAGDKYILNGSGVWVLQPSANAWENVYTKAEIDSMITEIYDIIAYYHTTLVSDTGEIAFYALAGYIGTWTIYGNSSQSGTPTPDNPVMPEFVGTLSDSDWTIPITCAGQTVPVYLGQVSTVRRVKKVVLTGQESGKWSYNAVIRNGNGFYNPTVFPGYKPNSDFGYCTHYPLATGATDTIGVLFGGNINVITDFSEGIDTAAKWESYLATQYANGTPVTVWYALAEPTTDIVNEPLCKIGDYCDELHSEDAGVTIPTVKGSNTLTVDTTLKPSKIEISGER